MKPYTKAQKIRLPAKLDRRIKLTLEDRADIKRLYFQEKNSIREIARTFENKCTRRMIQFILFPERRITVIKHAKTRGQSRTSYLKERGAKWNARQRELKNRKYQLYKKSQ